MTSSLQPIVTGEFSASPNLDGDRIFIQLKGSADVEVRDRLESLLNELHAEAQSRAIGEVALDIRDLEFMNSSCFKSFVSWIGSVQDMESAAQYRIRFISAPAVQWQRRSLHALQCFAMELVTVEQAA